LNVPTVIKYMNEGLLSLSGLGVDEADALKNVFGKTFFQGIPPPSKIFDGNSVANGRMAYRFLNNVAIKGPGGSDRQRVINYTSKVNQDARGKSYDWYAPRFKRFFDCYGAFPRTNIYY
jgi:hypothetical protein